MCHKIIIAIGTAISVIWLVLVCQLAQRFNIPSADGILYSLPLANAKQPLDLGIPFLNNFDGYGASWGHHWPGAMWLKGVVFMAMPYSRTADVALLSIFQCLAAATGAWLVWQASGKMWSAAVAMILLLSDRLLLLACAGNRFESIAVAVVLLLFAFVATDSGHAGAVRRGCSCLLAFLCPTLHPYAFVMGAIVLAYECLSARHRQPTSLRNCGMRLAAFVLGCLAVIAWFATQPDALRQFTANLAIQKSFYHNWNSVLDELGNYRLRGGEILWGSGLLAAGLLVAGWPSANKNPHVSISPAWRFLAPALLFAVIFIHTITRCENFHYLAFGTPFAVIMACVVAGRAADACHPLVIRSFSVVLLGIILLLHVTILPFRLLQFVRAGCPDLSAEMSDVLAGIPSGRTVFIPHLFWSAALTDYQHVIRWFTFPIASAQPVRQRYEQLAYAQAKPGDVLIIDGSTDAPDRFGLYPTFPLHPPDPLHWKKISEKKHLFQGSITWGLDLAVYEFTGRE